MIDNIIAQHEGIALTGDPNYGIIMEAYPFVARKVGFSQIISSPPTALATTANIKKKFFERYFLTVS